MNRNEIGTSIPTRLSISVKTLEKSELAEAVIQSYKNNLSQVKKIREVSKSKNIIYLGSSIPTRFYILLKTLEKNGLAEAVKQSYKNNLYFSLGYADISAEQFLYNNNHFAAMLILNDHSFREHGEFCFTVGNFSESSGVKWFEKGYFPVEVNVNVTLTLDITPFINGKGLNSVFSDCLEKQQLSISGAYIAFNDLNELIINYSGYFRKEFPALVLEHFKIDLSGETFNTKNIRI